MPADLTREEIERIRDGYAGAGWMPSHEVDALLRHALGEPDRIEAAITAERDRCMRIAADRIWDAREGKKDGDLRGIAFHIDYCIRVGINPKEARDV